MQLEALALRMRPRAPLEAADLGVRLCQDAASSVYACYAVVYVPILALALLSFEIASWFPTLFLFWAKPWLDRTILFVLSRAAFGQPTTVRQLWEARGRVWGRQLLLTWTWRRLSPWRSFTQPVYQLEGLAVGKIRRRVRRPGASSECPSLSPAAPDRTIAVSSNALCVATNDQNVSPNPRSVR